MSDAEHAVAVSDAPRTAQRSLYDTLSGLLSLSDPDRYRDALTACNGVTAPDALRACLTPSDLLYSPLMRAADDRATAHQNFTARSQYDKISALFPHLHLANGC